MKIAKTSRILTPIEDWHQLPNGKTLLKQTQQRIDSYLPRCFGYHLLKLGRLSSLLDTSRSTISHQINCASDGEGIGLLADLHQLPLQTSSVDLCILAHELDFSSDPHQLLREIDRVLTLDGTLIISGYNPISLFGLRSLLKPKHSQTARLFLPNRVRDWLHLLGFEVKQKQHFDFLSGEFNSSFSSCIESIGQRYTPYFCSVYFIVAKKQCTPLTPVKSPFQFKKPSLAGRTVVTRSR
ncbi:class I SAM-dependent methyltransferase [Psychromonas aquimarina]|uniref:class I SAM-dependent methyltransferase n=1 Tax=Psychromonas aquimarina TaxID=444919 RepID=UPI0003FCEE91|nr:methyltransferase domain-containing protein [Psychromonas aquimarina]